MYVQYKINVSENQVVTLKDAFRLKKGVTLFFLKVGIRGDHVLLLTPEQINRLDKAQVQGNRIQIRLSAKQVTRNVSYTGGFIGICYRVQKMKGDGLYLAPHPCFVEGDGLFLKHGEGLLMGKNSPFKNIPVLGWLL